MKISVLLTLLLLIPGISIVKAQKQTLTADTTLAQKFYEQGLSFQQKGSFDSAMAVFSKGALLYKQHRQWERFFNCENKIARSLLFLGKYEEVLQKVSLMQQERQDRLERDDSKEADALHLIGVVYFFKGEYDQALQFNQKALQLRREIFKKNHPDIAASYSNIGNVYFHKGEYDQALTYTQQALAIKLETLGEFHPDLANTYNTLGNIYSYKGELDKALDYNHKALHLWKKTLSETHPNVAAAYNNIGSIYYEKGEYQKAIEYYEKNLQIILTSLSPAHPQIGIAYYNIGNLYTKQGEFDNALLPLQKALEIRQHFYGEIHKEVADSYKSIGNVYCGKGNFDLALSYYQKNLEINLSSISQKSPSLADAYNSIGATYAVKGNYVRALKKYQQAILANIPSFQDTLVTVNPKLSDKSRIYLDANLLLNSLQSKANILEKLFKQSHAIADLQLAYQTYCTTDTLIRQIQHTYSRESDKIAFSSRAKQIYQMALPVCVQLQALTQDRPYLDKAFYFAERTKATVLTTTLTETKAKAFAGIADSLLAEDRQLRTQIASYTQQVVEELTKNETTDSTKLNEYQALLFSTYRLQESLVNKLEKEYPQYYKLKYQQAAITSAQLQPLLDEKTAIVEYAATDSVLHIFTITHHTFDVQTLHLDNVFRRRIAAFREAIFRQDEDLYLQVAHSLYKTLLPQAFPSSIQQLIIIPEGELTTFPFEALLTQNIKNGLDQTKSYLLNKYAISYVYSARLLYEKLTQPKNSADKRLLALAPVFPDTTPEIAILENRPILAKYQPALPGNSARTNVSPIGTKLYRDNAKGTGNEVLRGLLPNGQYVAPLLASKREVETIAHLFRKQGNVADLYVYNQAQEELLKSGDISKYTYIHLATHGFVDENYPELSGLLLAQDTTSGEDGILYMGEIYNLHLKADLVTLSACETGLGKLVNGEGVLGLSRALLYAGAQNIVVSFWKVPDVSTADLMEDFYATLLSSGDKALALQTAKQKMVREGKYSHPFYWAPFVLIGK